MSAEAFQFEFVLPTAAVPIRKVINGSPVSAINPATLRNPDCLEEYVALGLKMRQEEGMA